MKSKIAVIFLLACIMSACGEQNFVPKPIAYPRIELPVLNNFLSFESDCPYTFEFPQYVEIVKDSFFFEDEVLSNCWINMNYPTINAKVHFSYKEIGKDITFEKVMEDTHELEYNHSKKADYIDEYPIENKNGVRGLMIDIGGNAANNLQFYLSDNEKHYLRGALYFSSSPNVDSIQPALDFVKADMLHLFETFEWK